MTPERHEGGAEARLPLAPEFRFLLASAAVGQPPIETPSAEDLDWSRVVEMADDHGVLVLLSRFVEKVFREAVPPDTLQLLREYTRTSTLRSRMLAAELVRLLNLFASQGIPVIPYKGPVLAAMAYEEQALRQFRDLDLVVREADVSAASRLLEAQGYHAEMRPLTPAQQRVHRRLTAQCEFVSAEGFLHVDLHWDVMPRSFPLRLDDDRLWTDLKPVSLDGGTLRTFSPEDSLHLLCAHGTKDGWHRLVWVCDVDRLVRSLGELDWRALLEKAASRRCERMLLLGLRLAADLLGTPVHAEVLRRTRAMPSVDMLARKILASLPEGRGPALSGLLECLGVKRLYFEACDRRLDRAAYACRTLVVSDAADWARTRLPDSLFPLYYALRPLHRVSRCLGVLWRRLVAAGGEVVS